MSDYNNSKKTMCVAINGQTLLEEEYDASFNLFDYVTPNPFVFDIVLPLLGVTYKLYSSISFRHLFKVYENCDLDDAYKVNRNEFWDILKSNSIDTDDILRKLDGDYIELSDALASDNQVKFFSLIGNYSRVAQVANMYSSLKKATFGLHTLKYVFRSKEERIEDVDCCISVGDKGETVLNDLQDYIRDILTTPSLNEEERDYVMLGTLVEQVFTIAFQIQEMPRSLFKRDYLYQLEDLLATSDIKGNPTKYAELITEFRRNYEMDKADDDSSEIIAAWKKKFGAGDINNFTLKPTLNNEEVRRLVEGLRNNGYIDDMTTVPILAHILGGDRCYDYHPVVWIKKTKGNPSKVSVLNFLRLLGVSLDNMTLERLNYCFVTPTCKGSFMPFDYKNLKGKGKKNKSWKSDCHENLKEIIQEALGKGHIICRIMENLDA